MPLGLRMNSTRGKNYLLRRGALVFGELVWLRVIRMIRPFLWWWLVLFIEALVLSPNV